MTHRQHLFIQEYLSSFNATEAAKKAGYSPRCAFVQGARLLKNAKIQEAISNTVNERTNKLIADRQEREELLTSIMRDNEQDTKHRLRAVELLGKMQGDYIIKSSVEVKTDNTLADLILSER